LETEKSVVLTGGFQYLHQGHLNIISRAAEYGTLTVLLNSDAGLRYLKGYLAESFEIRKKNLLKTGLVNRVLKFHSDPTMMLCLLKPDFIVVGNDHEIEEVMNKGGEHAGQIIILPRTPGISSREIFKKENY
jgi:D-beta-D-heptose 7-phosphate kinase/D-beta-D-heptose 1-phosphate adenosyltransferase